jgi:hypothetical protein
MISGSEYYFAAKRSPLLIMRVAARRGYEHPLKTKRARARTNAANCAGRAVDSSISAINFDQEAPLD